MKSPCHIVLMVSIAATVGAEDSVSFIRDVRPLLSSRCFACHGPDAEHREADLRLDLAAEFRASDVVSPGKPDESPLWERVSASDPDLVMPPPDSGVPLTAEEKDLLRQWIESGAPYQQHWSFTPPKKPSVEASGNMNPIDWFIKRRLKAEGLSMNPAADRRTLIRRITLDLTGLPPTHHEIEAFLADDADGAIERLIDRLTDRITYGEHMARYWLDLARYADTHGLHLDNERSMWPYRDWVVRAFHENLPFNEFTRWQLAGDLLEEPTRDQLVASGFNRCNVTTSEGGSIAEEWVFRYAVDRTTTMSEVWMGLTAGCAVCHDHKFDPLSSVDYYSMYAFFHSAADPAMDGNKVDTPPILKLYAQQDQARIHQLTDEIESVNDQLQKSLSDLKYTDPALADPPLPKQVTETVWFEDGFPAGAKLRASGAPLQLVSAEQGEVFSGDKALRRKAKALEQDFYNSGASDLVVPAGAKVIVHCYLDPIDPPQAIMIQFHTDRWKHRAVWGAEEKIGFGNRDTSEKVLMGKLPETGKWVRLEVPASKMGLKAGAKVSGFAFTQFAGTVTWDHLCVSSEIDRAKDLAWSFEAWTKRYGGTRNNALPEGLRQLVRGKKPDKWTPDESQRVLAHWLEHNYAGVPESIKSLKAEKTQLEKEKAAIDKGVPLTMVMADLPKPRESFVMIRGAYNKPGEKVTRNVPSFLPPLSPRPTDRDYNRLDLANWLVSGTHPLTARVTVNRLWQQFFGNGIVATSADFGSQGEPPSHPELLDWLAIQFVEDGWDVQRLIRRIVTSKTYQQSSRSTSEKRGQDPDNRLLSRGPRLRLDAEVLRDQALHVSGLLVEKVGGKGVNPYQPPNIWEPVGFGSSNTRYYKQGKGQDLYRRSFYTFLKRTAPPPFMSTFDAPNREQSCSRRGRSNTPMQALQLMNDVQHVEAARAFATRMIQEGGADAAARIAWAWIAVTAREPTEIERQVAMEMLEQFEQRYSNAPEDAAKLVQYGESTPPESISKPQLAAYTMLGNLLLNLDETINKN